MANGSREYSEKKVGTDMFVLKLDAWIAARLPAALAHREKLRASGVSDLGTSRKKKGTQSNADQSPTACCVYIYESYRATAQS